jgi:hypothetical protein
MGGARKVLFSAAVYQPDAGYTAFFKINHLQSLTGPPTTLRWYPGTVRYTIGIESGQWREIGERPDAKGDFVKFFEMTLQRSH